MRLWPPLAVPEAKMYNYTLFIHRHPAQWTPWSKLEWKSKVQSGSRKKTVDDPSPPQCMRVFIKRARISRTHGIPSTCIWTKLSEKNQGYAPLQRSIETNSHPVDRTNIFSITTIIQLPILKAQLAHLAFPTFSPMCELLHHMNHSIPLLHKSSITCSNLSTKLLPICSL